MDPSSDGGVDTWDMQRLSLLATIQHVFMLGNLYN